MRARGSRYVQYGPGQDGGRGRMGAGLSLQVQGHRGRSRGPRTSEKVVSLQVSICFYVGVRWPLVLNLCLDWVPGYLGTPSPSTPDPGTIAPGSDSCLYLVTPTPTLDPPSREHAQNAMFSTFVHEQKQSLGELRGRGGSERGWAAPVLCMALLPLHHTVKPYRDHPCATPTPVFSTPQTVA